MKLLHLSSVLHNHITLKSTELGESFIVLFCYEECHVSFSCVGSLSGCSHANCYCTSELLRGNAFPKFSNRNASFPHLGLVCV